MRKTEEKCSFLELNYIMQLSLKRGVKKVAQIKTMRLKSEQRRLIGVWIRQHIPIKLIALSFSCSRVTVWYWGKQDMRTRFNIPRNYESKITIEAEISILFFRSLGYGTARIRQRLFCAPELELSKMEVYVQKLIVSRQTINKVLKRHKLNGYKRKSKKAWKFFRAAFPNELWQLDLKEFKFEGKKYYFLVCIDDYSRFLLLAHQFDHAPNIPEISEIVKPLIKRYHPVKILTDNSPFKESWKNWCVENSVKAIFAHTHYPQDKGKVERAIRNIAEELVNIIIIFRKLLSKQEVEKWIGWFNNERKNLGINAYPAELYVKN